MASTRVKIYRDVITVGPVGFVPERVYALIRRNRKPGSHEVTVSIPGSSLRSYEACVAADAIDTAGIAAVTLNDTLGDINAVAETLENLSGDVRITDFRAFSRDEIRDAELVKVDGYQFYVTQIDGEDYIIPDLESREWIQDVAGKDDVLPAGEAFILRKPLGECERCKVLIPVDQVQDVKTRRATQLDPPEYTEVCEDCADPEPEWEPV